MKIKVLNNKEELERIAIDFQESKDFDALYRANVNAQVTTLELSIMDIRYKKRACALAIWLNNNSGINKQSRRRLSYISNYIQRLCSISRTTFWSIIKQS